MRHWTQKERMLQSKLIKQQKPWQHSTGPKTLQGKAKSKLNSYKHGGHEKGVKKLLQFIDKCKKSLVEIKI